MKSLSAIERANPPPRRKSCQACIKAKRRCDLGQPACVRCRQRLLECRYDPNILTGRNRRQAESEKRPATTDALEPDFISPTALEAPAESGPVASESAFIMPDTALPSAPTLDAGFDFLSPELDLDMLQFIQDTPGEPLTDDFFTIPRPMTPPQNKLGLVRPLNDTALVLQPDLKWKLRTTPISYTIAHRLQYAIDLVKDAPRRMVVEVQTPWSHPALYIDTMPRSMQDALASCGLYQAKNERNSAIILHTIRSRAQDLAAATPPPSSRPLDVLARVQALLLYAIILVFDGDIASRSAAEAATPALESAAIGLVGLFGQNPLNPSSSSTSSEAAPPPESLPLYPIGPAREFWQGWVLQESARRTYLTTFFLLQLYLLLKGDVPKKCDQRLYLCHFWTVSAHLWRAGDAFEFALAWRERSHFVVNNTVMKDVLDNAKGDDIEDFGKMILTTMLGIDETKGWLNSRGATL